MAKKLKTHVMTRRITFLVLFIVLLLRINAQNPPIDSLQKAFDKAENDQERFNNLLDQIAYYRLNDLGKARKKVNELNAYANKSNEKPNIARAKFHNAVQFRKEGNYDSSIVYYLEAIKLFEELGDQTQVSLSYASLGIAYWQLKEYDPALRFFRKAHYYIEKQGNPTRILSNFNNIAGVFFDLKQFDSALVYLNKGKVIAETDKDTASMADIYGNMGAVYFLMNDTANAMKLSLIGADYARRSNYEYQLFTSYGTIANVYFKRKNYKEAEHYFMMSLAIATRLGAMEGRRDNNKSLADVYNEIGDYKKAFQCIQNYIQINDSLITESRMKQMTGLEAKYQSEKKDKELLKERTESEKKSAITKALTVGLFLFLLLSFFAFRGYLNKRKYAFIIEKANKEIKTKSNELASRNKDVTDSINYARRIQYAVLPNEKIIYKAFPESFIYYKPKDIVSGDFYWFYEINANEFILACGDCTGHGVPGAFMTVIGCNLLNQTVVENKIYDLRKILEEVDTLLNKTLKQDGDRTDGVQDGMDISLLKVNKATKEIIISSAKRPAILIREKVMQEYKGSKFSLGGMRTGEKVFQENKITFQKNDMLYFYTDGYTDQFGGEKGKKFSSKRLKAQLMSIHSLPISEQKQNLNSLMNSWKGNLEQVDDMLVIGIKL